MKQTAALLLVFMIAACERPPPAPPIAVYMYGDEATPLAAQFAAFTEETGIPVDVRFGDSGELTDDVIAKRGSPPADVLITSNAADIWRAAEEGALRPITSAAFDAIADVQKDPDRYWTGVLVHLQFVVTRVGAQGTVDSWDQLGAPEFSGRLCLSSSRLAGNRSLIAYLVEERGVREAERLVRRWMRNLAVPPFASQAELLAALREGQCEYGVATSHDDLDGLETLSPKPHFFDVSAAGVGRHAAQPESAQRFVAWMLENRTDYFRGKTGLRPVSIAGWRDAEVRLLVERAGYR